MTFPSPYLKISSPHHLTDVLRQAKEKVADGTLHQVKVHDDPFASGDVMTVPTEGPWPDYLRAYFEDSYGNR
jgi:hypothetical protein